MVAAIDRINLNGLYYLGSFLDRETADAFAAKRTQGLATQEDLESPLTAIVGPFTGGLGRDRIPRHLAKDPFQYRRFWDSTVETIWGPAYLPILPEDSTHTGLEVLRCSTQFKGQMWTLWEDATSTDVIARSFDGATTTYGGGGALHSDAGVEGVALDIIAHKEKLLGLYITSNDIQVEHSTDGITWSQPATTQITANLAVNAVTAHEDQQWGKLIDIGGEAAAILWDEVNNTVKIFSCADSGDTWADESVDFSADGGLLGVAFHPGTDGERKLYILTPGGLYEVDTAPATWAVDKIHPNYIGGDDLNCDRLVAHDGLLFFALGVSTAAAARIVSLDTSKGVYDFKERGLDRDDGVTSDLLGGVRHMVSSGRFLHISLGGEAASRNGRIVTGMFEDETREHWVWHPRYQAGTANQEVQWIDVSASDDGVDRLHFAKRTATATSDAEFLAYPHTNPTSGVSIKRDDTKILELPFIDGGMPTINGNVTQFRAAARDLSADNTGQIIGLTYGVNEEARTANSNLSGSGEFISGDLDLDVASLAGLTGRSFAPRLTFNRDGTNTNTPILDSLETDYVKVPPLRKVWAFEVDLAKSGGLTDHGSSDKVIANIKTAEALATNPALEMDRDGTVYVRVHVTDAWKLRSNGGGPALVRRAGTSILLMEQPVGT